MIYAAIWLYGLSVGAIPIPEDAAISCTDMVAIMAVDTEAAFDAHRFGLSVEGSITRKGDWSYSCETKKPALGDLRAG